MRLAIFAFAVERGLCADNPARGVKKAPVRKVERFLSEAEIAQLAEGAEHKGAPYPRFPRLSPWSTLPAST